MIERQREEPPPDLAHSVIKVNHPGGSYEAKVNLIIGKENTLPQTALRGQVVDPGGKPVFGAKITVSVLEGESITGNDGQWVFYCELRTSSGGVTVTATTRDGRTRSAQCEMVGGKTTIVPPIVLS
jgi:hypothetical protein